MALSYVQSLGDGVTRTFDLTFDYLSRAHVTVAVDGEEVPFTWMNTYSIQTTTPPPQGSVVERRRRTPREERLVTFTDGSTLVATDMNVSTLQSFFLAQEAFDEGSASLAVTESGQYSAQTRRITNLGDPVNDQDAVTKKWALSAANTNLAAATAARDAAVSAKTAAETARTGAQTARGGAETAKTGAEAAKADAQAARDSASGHRLNAYNAQIAAEAARDAANVARTGSEAARAEAQSARTGAASARDAADASALRAENAAGIAEKPLSYGPQTLSEAEKAQARTNIDALKSNASTTPLPHKHTAEDINSGTFSTDRIPNLDAGKTTSGVFNVRRIPNLAASKITSGTLDEARIPNLNASKITAGTLPISRGGTGQTTEAGMRGVYTGTSATNTAFPIGTVIMCRTNTTDAPLGGSVTPRVNGVNFAIDGTGSVLAGTWRNRGILNSKDSGTANFYALLQRVV